MLRAEQGALQRSLEKERARAGETRQELLALKEAAATHEGRAAQLEDEMKDLRASQRKEAQEAARKRDALEQVTKFCGERMVVGLYGYRMRKKCSAVQYGKDGCFLTSLLKTNC